MIILNLFNVGSRLFQVIGPWQKIDLSVDSSLGANTWRNVFALIFLETTSLHKWNKLDNVSGNNLWLYLYMKMTSCHKYILWNCITLANFLCKVCHQKTLTSSDLTWMKCAFMECLNLHVPQVVSWWAWSYQIVPEYCDTESRGQCWTFWRQQQILMICNTPTEIAQWHRALITDGWKER